MLRLYLSRDREFHGIYSAQTGSVACRLWVSRHGRTAIQVSQLLDAFKLTVSSNIKIKDRKVVAISYSYFMIECINGNGDHQWISHISYTLPRHTSTVQGHQLHAISSCVLIYCT